MQIPHGQVTHATLTLFRMTAWPTARLTMKPIWLINVGPHAQMPGQQGSPDRRLPMAAEKSALRRILAAAGSIARHRHRDGATLVRR